VPQNALSLRPEWERRLPSASQPLPVERAAPQAMGGQPPPAVEQSKAPQRGPPRPNPRPPNDGQPALPLPTGHCPLTTARRPLPTDPGPAF
jgi:hypothetical protein